MFFLLESKSTCGFKGLKFTYFRIIAEILARSLANFHVSISGQTHGFIIYAMFDAANENGEFENNMNVNLSLFN